jgi:hypothetical protein
MAEARSSSSLKPYQYDAVLDGFISTEQPEVLYLDIELVGHGATADIFKVSRHFEQFAQRKESFSTLNHGFQALDRRSNSVVAIKKFKSKTKSKEVSLLHAVMI